MSALTNSARATVIPSSAPTNGRDLGPAATGLALAVADADGDVGTRNRVRALVVAQGPIGASKLAELLDLTPAGVRRHLGALVTVGEIVERTAVSVGPRGRGRPAREYVATPAAQGHLPDGSAALAAAALTHLAAVLGPQAVEDFAEARVKAVEARYRDVVDAAGPDVAARAQALALALSADGYAASTRSVTAGSLTVLQLCQGHCPVQDIAAQFPQLCEAETRLIARLLGVHVQRLATLATGGHACTTHIPTVRISPEPTPSLPSGQEGPA